MPKPVFTPQREVPSIIDRLYTRFRLFLLSRREWFVVLGIVVLSLSVVFSSRTVTVTTRLPAQADVERSFPTPVFSPTLKPSIAEETLEESPVSPGGFLELIPITGELTRTPTSVSLPYLTPSLSPTFAPIATVTPDPTPTSEPTIFLPPLPR